MSDSPPGYIRLDAKIVREACLYYLKVLDLEGDEEYERVYKRISQERDEHIASSWWNKFCFKLYYATDEGFASKMEMERRYINRAVERSKAPVYDILKAAQLSMKHEGSSLMISLRHIELFQIKIDI